MSRRNNRYVHKTDSGNETKYFARENKKRFSRFQTREILVDKERRKIDERKARKYQNSGEGEE